MTVPSSAGVVFGARESLAIKYRDLLAGAGHIRGLNGPREIPRLWDRHILNCATLAYLPAHILPPHSSVCDVGSGAGLPGIPLAIARPDLRITLLEPLERRVNFLHEAVQELGLTNIEVRRGRAGDADAPVGRFDLVTSRAVAPLGRLLADCAPLVGPGGWFGAIKGARAEQEIAELARAERRLVNDLSVIEVGTPDGLHWARVVIGRSPISHEESSDVS